MIDIDSAELIDCGRNVNDGRSVCGSAAANEVFIA